MGLLKKDGFLVSYHGKIPGSHKQKSGFLLLLQRTLMDVLAVYTGAQTKDFVAIIVLCRSKTATE